MTEQTAQLLLQEFRAFRDNEFRAFRDDVSGWMRESGERIAKLESEVKHGVSGNGQPSRLAVVEQRMTSLERFRWKVTGMGVAVWAAVETVMHWWKH